MRRGEIAKYYEGKDKVSAWIIKCKEDLAEMKKEFSGLNSQQIGLARSFAETVKSNKMIKDAVREVTLQSIETKDLRNRVIGK